MPPLSPASCAGWGSGITVGMSSANERRLYNVTSPLIGWARTQKKHEAAILPPHIYVPRTKLRFCKISFEIVLCGEKGGGVSCDIFLRMYAVIVTNKAGKHGNENALRLYFTGSSFFLSEWDIIFHCPRGTKSLADRCLIAGSLEVSIRKIRFYHHLEIWQGRQFSKRHRILSTDITWLSEIQWKCRLSFGVSQDRWASITWRTKASLSGLIQGNYETLGLLSMSVSLKVQS